MALRGCYFSQASIIQILIQTYYVYANNSEESYTYIQIYSKSYIMVTVLSQLLISNSFQLKILFSSSNNFNVFKEQLLMCISSIY